jgi:hypothetical protein
MPLWLIATGLGIALPMLFKKDGTPAQGQGAQAQGQQGQGNFFPGGVTPQFPPPSSYPIPFDRTIDPQSAYAVYQAWQTAPAHTLKAFAQEIFNQFPIAATALFARGLTLEQIAQAQQAHAAKMQAEAQLRAQQAATPPVAAPVQAVQVQPPQAFAGGMIPATQAARIVPTPSIQPEGAPQVVPSVGTNGAPAPAVAAPVAAPSPVAVGVG